MIGTVFRIILKSENILSPFCKGNILHKLLWKLKGPVATKQNNNIVTEIDCTSSEVPRYV